MSKKLSIFVCALCLVSIAVPANALTNGDFETGDLTGWWTYIPDTANSSTSVVSGGPSGSSYCLQVYTTTPSESIQIGQDVAFTAGTALSISLDYSNPSNSWAGMGISVNYYDSSWTYLDYGWVTIYEGDGTATGWVTWSSDSATNLTGTWTAPTGTAYVSIKLLQWGWEASASSYDNVSVTPEPATMVLLGIGGLLSLRRKHA